MSILNPAEISKAQEIISRNQPGIYELKDLYGSLWSSVDGPTAFGKRFKETVQTGLLQQIKLLTPPKTNNYNTYEIKC